MFDKLVSISYCNLSKGIVLQMENFYLLDSLHMNVIVWKFCILQRFNSLVTSLFCLQKKKTKKKQKMTKRTNFFRKQLRCEGTLERPNQSFIHIFSICMTVSLKSLN